MGVVVFDIGGYFTKFGIDKLKVKRTNVCYYKKNSFEIGPEAKGCLNIKPVKNGKVIDWTELEKMIEKIVYYDLEISNPSNYSVINVFPEDNPKFRDIFLERLNFSKYAYLEPISAILLGKRKKTGLVIDIGHDITKITPVYEGYEILSGVLYSAFTGKHIDNYLAIKSSKKKGIDWNVELRNLQNDGLDLVLDIKKSISKIDINLRKELLDNLIVTGFIFNETIKKDLEIRLDLRYKIDFDKKSRDLIWYGAKKLSNTLAMKDKWITTLNRFAP